MDKVAGKGPVTGAGMGTSLRYLLLSKLSYTGTLHCYAVRFYSNPELEGSKTLNRKVNQNLNLRYTSPLLVPQTLP